MPPCFSGSARLRRTDALQKKFDQLQDAEDVSDEQLDELHSEVRELQEVPCGDGAVRALREYVAQSLGLLALDAFGCAGSR